MEKKIEKARFPILLGRKAGRTLNFLCKTKNLNLKTLLKEVNAHEIDLEKEKQTMVAVIHSAIGNEENETIKRLLLNYKRDLFNGRNIKKYKYKIDDIELNRDLIYFNELTQSHKENVEKFKLLFDEELLKSIENLKEITDSFFFKNGILFSSEILYNQINKTDFKYSTLNKKNKKLVSSVLKYLTRSVTKTTPYSSFNNIFCLTFDQKEHFTNQIPKDFSHFQVINLFYHYLKLFLLEQEEFKNTLKVNANSTICIKKETNKINYFFNKENEESFKNIENNQILGFILDFLDTNPQKKYKELILKLQVVTEESKENIINYVETLINEGFINLSYPVSSTSPNWVIDLKNKLNQISFSDTELKEKIVALLVYILDSQTEIASIINVENRKDSLNKIYHVLVFFFKEYAPDSKFLEKVKEKDLFYEDTISSLESKIEISSIDKLSNELTILQNVFSNLLNHKKELKKFLTTFLVKDRKNILDFYEEIYLKSNKSFSFQEKSLISFNEIISKSISEINSSVDIEELDISPFFKPKFLKSDSNVSFGAYFQAENNKLGRIVLNNFSNGKGANISRFLSSFPIEYSKEVKEYNQNKESKPLTVEVKDASIHNTNTFPPLSESVISVSEDLALKNDYNIISLKDIHISKNDLNELILVNEKNLEIEPQIFSLEGINRRSKFTQFLDIFNKTDNSGFYMYLNSLNKYYKNLDNNISVIPRLVFKNKIVIQRKKWFVKKEYLLEVLNKETLAENFISINTWAKENKIPNKVFIKIMEQDFKNKQNDNYKPQFIDFESPIFMLLTINLIEKAEEIIELTEMYPNTSHIDNNDGYVKEYVININ